ncbi:MAG: TonB-dependent receptor domain-containing protein, partial [Acidobacteriota bacterium]
MLKRVSSWRASVVLICASALLVPMTVNAQSGRGALTGVVEDQSGAVVPGAEVKAGEQNTGLEYTALTTDAGAYRIPYLPAGTYRVSATLPGFKTAVAENVTVLLAQTLTVDFVLELGEVSQQVTVSSEAPLLEKSTSEIGINTTEKEVHTWPIIVGDGTRQLQQFIFTSLPGTQGGTFAGSINGGQSYSHEILIDGISIGRMDLNGGSNNEFTPTMDAVSEFKLHTGALSSQYGNTQTALVNFGLKSGTNAYHGTAFWFHKNRVLNANSWASNRTGGTKAPILENNFGATFGGPIIQDKTHFFVSYEGNRLLNQQAGGFDSLPVAAFRQGDFSALLDPNFTTDERSGTIVGTDALGRPIVFGQIYDPASSRQLEDGTWIRDPFPGNVIPQERFSQITRNVLQHDVPLPAINEFLNNNPRAGTCCPEQIIDNISVKIDHVLNDSHKLSGSFVSNDRSRKRFGAGTYQLANVRIPGPAMAGDRVQATPGYIFRLSEDWTIGPTMLNHLAIGYNRFVNKNQSNSFLSGNDWATELGLQNVGSATFPQIVFQGFNITLTGGYRNFGDLGTSNSPNGSTIISDDFTWLRGNHSFKFGFEHRSYYNNNQSSFTPGSYRFHNENTAIPGFASQTGFAYASFLLGEVRSTNLGIPLVTTGIRSNVNSFYFQDDWKMAPTLTWNIGIRWDIPQPLYEVAGRMSSLDPDLPNPGADGLPGALRFLEGDQNTFSERYWKQLSPRIGFAWAAGPEFVIRGGYGINFTPPILDGFSFPYTAGFNGANPINPRTGRFLEDPVYSWDDPYPAFTDALPNTDPAQRNNTGIGWYLPETNALPYVQNWNLGIQYALPWDLKLEANYIGNKGTRLNEPQYLPSLNQVDPVHLSLGDTLLDNIEDHPEIAKPYPSFEGTVAQALRPFPQFQGISTHRLNSGWSSYNALQTTFIKRSDYGLSFIAAYTFSKSLGTGDTAGPGNYGEYGQNFYNRGADYSVTSFHVPHDFKLTWIYDLPFGPQGR